MLSSFVRVIMELVPIVWMLAVAWASMGEARRVRKRSELYKVRDYLVAKVSLLRETRKHKLRRTFL